MRRRLLGIVLSMMTAFAMVLALGGVAYAAEYVDALNRVCVLDDLEAWTPRLRSKTAVRTSPTRHFCDPSLAAAMLNATPEKLLADFQTFGLLFESMCVRDLRVYVDALGGRIFHYRDKTGLEAEILHESLRLDHSSYDLAYLVLARRTGATLFTLDGKLADACERCGVSCTGVMAL